MGNDLVKAKEKELIEALAEETGVSIKDVTKILNQLGLRGALENRLVREKAKPKWFRFRRIKPTTLKELNLSIIRISAAADLMQ